ncbi:hypothetical protein GH741_20555 [Aquibacillus halophilus]|uniref:Uncharacterized protein n=1 Tax=Aquibacillus halophilus TaxID=930132 RepID=A0A6A8DH62_9BACI|nr:hypothetical protein [Aquibacillus halophilus]MRH45038.1 hypothetical protein [Aquibacillus halophilus]
MIFILLVVAFIFATWRWGDWRNWKLYHSTILYFLYNDMLYGYLTNFHYPLWIHVPVFPFDSFSVVKILAQICFACTPLIYLGCYPKERRNVILWIGFWIILYSSIEGGLLIISAVQHFNGWTLTYSVLFNMMMFPMLRLHFTRPLLAYTLSVPITITLLIINNVPVR